MSKAIVAVILLAGLVAISSGMVCPPQICKAVTCPDVTEETCQAKNEMYVPEGSICGCCPICISYPKMGPVAAPGDVPKKLCLLPFFGTGKEGFYPC